jgi:hypothetical protein
MICLHTEFHIPNSYGLLLIAIKKKINKKITKSMNVLKTRASMCNKAAWWRVGLVMKMLDKHYSGKQIGHGGPIPDITKCR